jgi:hypothetical protein
MVRPGRNRSGIPLQPCLVAIVAGACRVRPVPGGRRVAAGPEGGRRPPAGPALKGVEKSLQPPQQHGHDGARRRHTSRERRRMAGRDGYGSWLAAVLVVVVPPSRSRLKRLPCRVIELQPARNCRSARNVSTTQMRQHRARGRHLCRSNHPRDHHKAGNQRPGNRRSPYRDPQDRGGANSPLGRQGRAVCLGISAGGEQLP